MNNVSSGEVESVGSAVTKFKIGDSIFGSLGMNIGTYAEYVCVDESTALTLKPTNMSHKEAATVPFGGQTAISFLKKANIKPGQKVLIYG